ncbi:hypothetical protein GUJ93_ZPchr0001g30889 [Zizania palustris]|uniref:Protein kinase domain-containing protein n=1 Tax=Zizania palustris TaxID=103762 RepID=A0A8J5RU95_ZIZPA|nr:hypothetical protein GUJ93_ZPchr0001g30889 [Zizania palustris]
MVSWPEHASFKHGEPHEDDVLLELSRKGNLISGPSWLHLDGGQWLKKSSSSQDVACWLAPWCPTTDATNKAATRASSLILVPGSKGDGDEEGGRQTIDVAIPRHGSDIYVPLEHQACNEESSTAAFCLVNTTPVHGCGVLVPSEVNDPSDLVSDLLHHLVAGQNQQCPPSSCGDLHDIKDPFRLQGTYYVTSINYIDRSFLAVDANLQDTNSSCPLPHPDQLPDTHLYSPNDSYDVVEYFKEQISGASILNRTRALSWSEIHYIADCLAYSHDASTKQFILAGTIVSAIDIAKLHFVLFRFVLAPLVVFTFLAHKDKLGQGGYGSVYKGVLLPGDVHVAVKMLSSSSSCNGEEFISEVSTIGRIHHVNVVRLVGFCSEEMKRALVYEYMPGGSLDNNFVPKVADFGLAKLYPRDKSFVPVSAARGTIGYIAPEMISRSFGVISSKSDVYSFGMLLLEMAGGRRNADPNAANSSQAYYPSRVYSQLTRRHTTGEICDIADMHELEKKLCVVGLWCIQMKSCDRPTMSEVIEMLEGGTGDLQVPPRPFFCDDEQFPGVESHHLSSDLTAISEEQEEEDDENICMFQSY